MARSASSAISPDFISASSPQDLRRLLLINAINLGGEVQYISIGFDGKNWVAWFYNNLDGMLASDALTKVKSKK
jgi:hypothetical protein